MSKRCFVISPIGAPDSEVRERADDVLEFIIEPALRELGIEAVRADKLAEPGKITDQMIGAILGYDLCIADLSGQNPNVFYELAVAQAAERPVVLLMRAGEVIPFDVKDYRRIEYDIKPRSFMTGRWVAPLKEQIEKVMSPDYKPPKLLGGQLLRSSGIRTYLINVRSKEFGEAPRFYEIVQHAREYCNLMGISLQAWGLGDGRRVLEKLAVRRVPVRVLIMDPAHPGLATMINSLLPTQDLDAVRKQVVKMADYFKGIAEGSTSFQFRVLRQGMPHFQLTVTEETALALQYMFSRGTGESPLQQFPRDSDLHVAFLEEFEALWAANA